MGDTPLYVTLKGLDPKLAKVYFDITHDDPTVSIQEDDVDAIFLAAVDKNNTITSKALDAMIAIIQAVPFTREAQDRLLLCATSRQAEEALANSAGKLLKTADELKEVTKALDLAAQRVKFASPGTHLTYGADDYAAMKSLILTGDIWVVSVKDRGLVTGDVRPKGAAHQGAVASYDVAANPPALFLFDFSPTLGPSQWIAHELTHAIQDWSDDQSPRKYREADAYIAQGLTFIGETGKRLEATHPAKPCVDFVLAGIATRANKDWIKTYEDFATLIGGTPLNSQATPKNLKGDEKKAKLAELLKAAQKASKATPAAPAPKTP